MKKVYYELNVEGETYGLLFTFTEENNSGTLADSGRGRDCRLELGLYQLELH